MRSIDPLRELFHLHPGEADWGTPARPGTGRSAGNDAAPEPFCNGAHDWEQYWIDLGGEG